MFNLQRLQAAFGELSSARPRLFSAPGRVNLIGEHTDYNEGFVLPMGANLRTYVAAAPRNDGKMRVHSVELNETASFSLDDEAKAVQEQLPGWMRFVHGVTRTLMRQGLELRGADLAINSDVPIGAGLSSSAALEVSVGFSLINLAGAHIGLVELALAAQRAEHLFVGTNSGLMDQLTATAAQQGHALLIDCRSLQITPIPILISNTAIVVCDTKVKHSLVSSSYNARRQECERAVTLLRERNPAIRSLRDVSVLELHMIDDLPEPERRRARHVVTENARTLLAAEQLQTSDTTKLGQLMTESHKSLRDDYEVSCPELDIMVEIAQSHEGVFGARMMGGGFGGSTINLVDCGYLDHFTKHVASRYFEQTQLSADIYIIEADAGVNELIY